MKKIITVEQIEAIKKELVNLNIPVQNYLAIQGLFSQLPVLPNAEEVKEPKDK